MNVFAANAKYIIIMFAVWLTLIITVTNKEIYDEIFIQEEIHNLKLYKEHLESIEHAQRTDETQADLELVK